MDKSLRKKDLYVGQLVTRGEHADAQVYTVAEIDGNAILLAWQEGTRKGSQWTDCYDCYKPTLKQIEYSINQNGPLVPACDI